MDNVPEGFTPGEDYVSVVSADNYGNGIVSAHIMAEALGGEGKIGLVFFAADFFVTQQRQDAFKATIEENYPDIEIVEEQGIPGPDFAGHADHVASAMLTRNAELNGIWAVWDVPAEGVINADPHGGPGERCDCDHDRPRPERGHLPGPGWHRQGPRRAAARSTRA